MEIKYEAVFGDQSLFDSAEPDVFLVETDGVYKTFHKETTGKVSIWTRRGCDLAMRRIIRTPTWTVADQQAGRLPDVGCRVFDEKNENEVIVKAINTRQVCLESPDGFIYLLPPDDIQPIESPEEKAARLEDEFSADIGLPKDLERIEERLAYKRGLRDAYRKLSGDLPVPAKEK